MSGGGLARLGAEAHRRCASSASRRGNGQSGVDGARGRVRQACTSTQRASEIISAWTVVHVTLVSRRQACMCSRLYHFALEFLRSTRLHQAYSGNARQKQKPEPTWLFKSPFRSRASTARFASLPRSPDGSARIEPLAIPTTSCTVVSSPCSDIGCQRCLDKTWASQGLGPRAPGGDEGQPAPANAASPPPRVRSRTRHRSLSGDSAQRSQLEAALCAPQSLTPLADGDFEADRRRLGDRSSDSLTYRAALVDAAPPARLDGEDAGANHTLSHALQWAACDLDQIHASTAAAPLMAAHPPSPVPTM